MSNPSADSPALPSPQSQSWPAGPSSPGDGWLAEPKPPGEGWTQQKFFLVLAFVFAFHVALIFLFGTKKPIIPRALTNVPHLQLADNADEFIGLGDPTLFARPNAHDLVTAYWRRTPAVKPPNFDWTEPPLYLPPAPENFGAAFRAFVQNNTSAKFSLDFKPEPKLTAPELALDDAMPQATTMHISGELGQRLLNPVELPSLPRNDVVAPSKVQALVDTAGNVASAVVIEPNADTDADQRALQLARRLRFAPAPHLTFGDITFNWHTVPANAVPPTNAP
jgi:TonB family protein